MSFQTRTLSFMSFRTSIWLLCNLRGEHVLQTKKCVLWCSHNTYLIPKLFLGIDHPALDHFLSRLFHTPPLSLLRVQNNCYLRRGSNNEISTSNRVSSDLYIFLLTCCYALYLVGEYGTRYHVRPHWPPTESSPHGNTGAEEYFLYQQYCFVGVAAWRTVGELMAMQPSKWLIVF